MSVPRACVGCQRGFGLLTSVHKELIDPRWQRQFRTAYTARPNSHPTSYPILPRQPAPPRHGHHNPAARHLSTTASSSQPPLLPSTATEWRAIRSGHVSEPLTAIVVTGAAASAWLQGLITADMAAIDRQQYGYTAVLNFKGRVVFTALVVKAHSDQPSYHLMLPSAVADAALTHLSKLNFRRKVTITTQPVTLHHILPTPNPTPSAAPQPASHPSTFPDPRTALLGSVSLSSEPVPPAPQYHAQVFDLLRHLHCIPVPGSPELAVERSLPLDCSLDHLHAIAFNKGCYIGQEVTARAHYTGTLRKRLYSAYLTRPQPQPHTAMQPASATPRRLRRLADYRTGQGLLEYGFIEFGVQLAGRGAVGGGGGGGGGVEEGGVLGVVMGGGKEVGKVYSCCFNVAIVQLRIESVECGDRLTTMLDGKEFDVTPFELDWWPTDEQQQSEDEVGTVFVADQPTQ